VRRNPGAFNCGICRQKHCDATGEHPGSIGPAGYPMWAIKEAEIESRTCFLPMVTEESWLFLRLYQHYKNGILPFPGGLLEQPHVYLKAMELLDHLYG
jgi:hypothetical protein